MRKHPDSTLSLIAQQRTKSDPGLDDVPTCKRSDLQTHSWPISTCTNATASLAASLAPSERAESHLTDILSLRPTQCDPPWTMLHRTPGNMADLTHDTTPASSWHWFYNDSIKGTSMPTQRKAIESPDGIRHQTARPPDPVQTPNSHPPADCRCLLFCHALL
jgi:hypothetical protein